MSQELTMLLPYVMFSIESMKTSKYMKLSYNHKLVKKLPYFVYQEARKDVLLR